MKRYVFDLETNGLVHELDRVHCLVIRDADTNEVYSCADHPGYDSIHTGLTLLSQADMLIGHNIINFDFRALFKLFPNLSKKKDCIIYDTLVVSRVLWPELEPIDEKNFSHIDKKYVGRHSLGAWGERLGVKKLDFQEKQEAETLWDEWSEEMQTYCEGDTLVSLELYKYFQTQELDPRCFQLEHNFAIIMSLQEDFGFPFNEKGAYALVNTLKLETEIDDDYRKNSLQSQKNVSRRKLERDSRIKLLYSTPPLVSRPQKGYKKFIPKLNLKRRKRVMSNWMTTSWKSWVKNIRKLIS